MIISNKQLAGILLSLSLLIPYGGTLHAATNTDFNPNFILSDAELQDWRAMDRADIYAFLNDQTGILDTFRSIDKDGVKKLAVDIIYQAAKEHSINPKYLLVKLQKEQSLISTVAPTQKQLDGATGYGITDSCGWSCDTYLNNKGFGKQVDSAAGIMRWYYDNISEPFVKKEGQTYSIGTESITPQSNATGFLYTYTPHIQGNENFWNLWQTWFKQVYPDGSLVKVTGDDAVYLIKDGMKHEFTSYTALTTRFDPKNILVISNSELGRYTTGDDISFPNYSIIKAGSTFYLLDDDTLRPFKSEAVVRSLGYHPDETIVVSTVDVSNLQKGTMITAETTSITGELLRIKESGTIYHRKDDVLSLVIDEAIATSQFPNQSIITIPANELGDNEQGDPLLFKNGSLILLEGSNKVYVIENGKKRHIANEEVFIGMGYQWENIIRTKAAAGMFHPTGQPIYLQRSTLSDDEAVVIKEVEQSSSTNTETQTEASTWDEIKELMVRTPASQTAYIGKAFTTDMDSYLVLDIEADKIIMGKNIDTLRPTASLAKVMTGYQLIKDGLSMSKSTTYDPTDHKAMYHKFRITEGEAIRNSDLMDAFLTSSLNTPGRMLVDAIEPNEQTFISKINTTLASWGLDKTNFTSVTGEEIDTVTTAREYATLFLKASKFYEVQKRLGQKNYQYTETTDLDGRPDHYDYHSNKLANEAGLPYTITASKTGYLYESGANLAMSVKRLGDNKKFLIITMGNVDFYDRFSEPKRLAEYVMTATY